MKNDVPGLRQLWKLAFGDTDAFLDSFFSTAYSPDRCHLLKVDGRVAAALYWFRCSCDEQRIAYVYAVATHPDFRGQGLCRKLMQETHALLTRQGYDAVMLVPQDAGLRKMYAAMGYRDATAVTEFTCQAGEPIPLTELDADAYVTLRRQFLPAGAVVQEGENLRFLNTYARFYRGDDCLLAVSGSQILELLGSRENAPGILAALGLAEGSFRTPGQDIPYAMFLPLGEYAPMPSYFGFAFD